MCGSAKTVDKPAATAGDVLTYQLTLRNPSRRHDLPGVLLTDPVPSHTTFVQGSLWASDELCAYAGDVITWTGTVSVGAPVTVTFQVTVDQAPGPRAVVNRAVLDDGVGATRTLQATTLIDPVRYYFPIVFIMAEPSDDPPAARGTVAFGQAILVRPSPYPPPLRRGRGNGALLLSGRRWPPKLGRRTVPCACPQGRPREAGGVCFPRTAWGRTSR